MKIASKGDYPINVLYVNPVSKMAGAEYSLLALIDGLDQKKWRPFLLCPEDGLLPRLCRDRGIKVFYLPTIPRGGGLAQETYRTLLPNAWKIKKIIQENNIRLVHSNNPRVSYHGGLGARLAGVPDVMHVRDIENLPFSPFYKAVFIDLICDRIIPVSSATRDEILQHTKLLTKKIEVVHNGVVFETKHSTSTELLALRSELGVKNHEYVLAVAGRITPSKGYDVIIRAISLLTNRFHNIRLLVIGEAWEGDELYLERLRNLSNELGVSDNVTFTGFRKDILRILNIVDVFVHCPVEPDPLPRVLLEASAYGKAIVAANTGGVNEIIQHEKNGLLVRAGDVNGISGAILRLLEDSKLRMRLEQAAKENASDNFSIKKHVQSIENIYNQLLRLT